MLVSSFTTISFRDRHATGETFLPKVYQNVALPTRRPAGASGLDWKERDWYHFVIWRNVIDQGARLMRDLMAVIKVLADDL